MHRSSKLRPCLALVLAVVVGAASLPGASARAAMIPTEQAVTSVAPPTKREQVLAFLTRDDVVRQMVALGVDPAEAAARARALSDAELGRIAGELERLPAGQSAIGTVVGAALVVFLVLLLTDILGLTDVFPFVRR